ncbi:MAG: multicopper oxidase domain-containing protein [Terriglobales bacterium]
MTRRSLSAVLLIFLALSAHASGANPSTVPTAQANDNRVAAGELKRGVLNLQLEMVEATWYPEKDGGKSLSVYAFAEKGKAPQIPGPLIRVPQGTEVRVQIHNTLPLAMFVRGLHSHDAASPEPVLIAAGATAELHFIAQSPGTYYYSARSTKMSLREIGLLSIIEDLPMGEGPFGIESQLDGGLIVDPPGAPANDRTFMITTWMAGVITPPFREWVAINGKSWPYTERLSYRTGDSARWRLINTSVSDHAMHLHGFYFQVTSAGDQDRDDLYSPDQVPHVVTRHLEPGETASIVWTPDRPGRWLLHCHMTAHMVPVKFPTTPTAEPDSHLSLPDGSHDSTGMLGLVLGITISPGLEHAAASASALKPRQLRLLVREKSATRFSLARMGYLIQEGTGKETSDPPPIPGAPLVLTRGEPTEITVVNQLKEQTSVHWHGIELESYYDGVPGWSGDSPQITPPILPGGTFVARMTPPRAGTFIYHTHWHDVAQLTSGLYGPLIVVEPGQKFDPEVDKIFIVSRQGPEEAESPLLLNGSAQPPPLVLKLGTKYRLRFINIGTNDSDAIVSFLTDDAQPVLWRAVAKDGWTLPAAQATPRPASQLITVGETYDFEFLPERAGEFTLQVSLRFLKTTISQSVTVR